MGIFEVTNDSECRINEVIGNTFSPYNYTCVNRGILVCLLQMASVHDFIIVDMVLGNTIRLENMLED